MKAGVFVARVIKCRRVCCEPKTLRFTPECGIGAFVTLSVEELESIRLCDLESMEQDKADEIMEISRGTFQRIIYSARAKVAEALCCGKGIFINGGNYEIAENGCSGNAECSRCRFREQNTNQQRGDA